MEKKALAVVCREENLEDCSSFFSCLGYNQINSSIISKESSGMYHMFQPKMFEGIVSSKPTEDESFRYLLEFERFEGADTEKYEKLEDRYFSLAEEYNAIEEDIRFQSSRVMKNPFRSYGPVWPLFIAVAVSIVILVLILVFCEKIGISSVQEILYICLFGSLFILGVAEILVIFWRKRNVKKKLTNIAEESKDIIKQSKHSNA